MTELLDLAASRTVALTTYRRTGEAVATPVWVARDGDTLVVSTGSGTGKVKRIRHTPHVQLQPCTQRGTVAPGAPAVTGTATVGPVDGTAMDALRAKYGLIFRIILTVERLVARKRSSERVIVRISAV